jgi:hypothetical protein
MIWIYFELKISAEIPIRITIIPIRKFGEQNKETIRIPIIIPSIVFFLHSSI